MPQSLAKIDVHLIFSTKNRERLLPDDLRPGLHTYLGGILRDLGCTAVEINSEPDHAHLLFLASRTETLSDVVRQLKTGSNLWLRSNGLSCTISIGRTATEPSPSASPPSRTCAITSAASASIIA